MIAISGRKKTVYRRIHKACKATALWVLMISLLLGGSPAALAAAPIADVPAEGNAGGNYQAKAEEMSAFLLENVGVTTVQYALMDGDEIVLSNMVGVNDEWNKPVFCIASTSKMHVTAAVMMLVDQGRIDLDVPVAEYMPEFTMADERYKEITPRMLLNHSSGLYGTTMLYGNSMSLGSPSTVGRDAFFEYKKGETLKADPGEMSVYCNDGFILAEFLVEKVSGMTYVDFVKNNISKPLGLTYTTTALDPELDVMEITLTPGVGGEPMVEYMNYLGTGGVYSTAEELCKFSRLFMNHYPEILSKESAEMTFEPEFAKGLWVEEDIPNMLGYGLGWDNVRGSMFSKYGIRAVNKGGDASFHHADLTVLPDHNISMAVLTAGGNSGFNTLMSANVLLEYLNSKGIIEELQEDGIESAPPVKVDMPEELKKYEGLYGTGGVSPRAVQIAIDDGEMTLPGGMGGMIPDMMFVYTGEGEFTAEDGTTVVYFKEEANGKTYMIQRAGMRLPGFGAMVLEGHDFEKLEPQQLSGDVQAAWALRTDKRYMCVNEMYNSSNYMDSLMMTYSPVVDIENGYVSGAKIVDGNQAVSVVQIPVMSGRDSHDLNFFESNGESYLNKCNRIFIAEDNISSFELLEESTVAIGAEGFAEWFVIDANTAGKELKVTVPEKSSAFVYDENLLLSAFSMDAGEQSFVIPSGGFIVFAGEAGTEFTVAQ